MCLTSQLAATLTIPNTGTNSNVIGVETLSDAENFVLQAPAVLTETVTFSVSYDGVNYVQLMDTSGVAVKCPVAATAIGYRTIPLGACLFLKLTAGVAVGADRVFKLMKQCHI